MPTFADFNTVEGLKKWLHQEGEGARFEDKPFNEISGIGQIPVAFALLGLLKEKNNNNMVYPYTGRKTLEQNVAYFSPCGYEMNEQLEGLKKLLEEAKKKVTIHLPTPRGLSAGSMF